MTPDQFYKRYLKLVGRINAPCANFAASVVITNDIYIKILQEF
jgi:hypothetical protein